MKGLDTTTRPKLKNILYPTDLSFAAERALPYAVELARRYGSTVHAVHVIQSDLYPLVPLDARPNGAEEEVLQRESKAGLDQQLREVSHDLIFQPGRVWETLSALIRDKQIDLVVLSTHGRTGLKKALLGSTTEEVFRKAPCPVLTIGPAVWSKPRRNAGLSRILYATDFSPESLAAAPYTISLVRDHRAQLILLHCIENGEEDVNTTLHTLRDLVPFGSELRCEPTCIAERGAHGEKIPDVAEGHGADLIVLGVPSAGAFFSKRPHFHRSALNKIVTHATCPVLTVRA